MSSLATQAGAPQPLPVPTLPCRGPPNPGIRRAFPSPHARSSPRGGPDETRGRLPPPWPRPCPGPPPWVSPWTSPPCPHPRAVGQGLPESRSSGTGGPPRLWVSGRRRVGERARKRVCVCVALRLPSGLLRRALGPPVASFPVLNPGPHRVEPGHLVQRCSWPGGRWGGRRREAPRPELVSIKSDKKFREK